MAPISSPRSWPSTMIEASSFANRSMRSTSPRIGVDTPVRAIQNATSKASSEPATATATIRLPVVLAAVLMASESAANALLRSETKEAICSRNSTINGSTLVPIS